MKNIFRLVLILILALGLLVPAMAFAAEKKTSKKAPTPVSKAKPNTEAMRKALQFWVFEKGGEFIGDVLGIVDYKEKKIILKCGLKNNTKKNIRGVRGMVRFTTLFGEYIVDLPLETTASVPAGRSISVEWTAKGERFSKAGFDKFQKLKLEEMRALWYPTVVVFADGTMLR